MTISLKRRTFMGSSLAALAVAGSTPAWAQDTRLRFFWWGNQDRANRTEAAMELFMAENPGVTVDGESAPFGDFFTRLATQLVAGNPPDLIQMDFRFIAEYANRGALLDLDPYLGNVLDLSEVPTDQVDANRVDGTLYGVSFGVNSAALMVNTAAWEEVGIEPPAIGTTYEELAENAARLTEATTRSSFYGVADASGNDIAFENWLRQQGRELYTADGELDFSAENASDWFQLWAEMRASRACPPADIQALDQQTIETSMIVLGHAATGFALANQLQPHRSSVPDPIVMTAFPVIGPDALPGHYLRPATRLSVAAATAHPDEAVALLAFLTGNPEAAKILGAERGIPVAPSLQEAMAPVLADAERESVEYIASLGDLVGALPPLLPPGAGEVQDALREISQQVAFGAISPQDAGSTLVDTAQGILARSA